MFLFVCFLIYINYIFVEIWHKHFYNQISDRKVRAILRHVWKSTFIWSYLSETILIKFFSLGFNINLVFSSICILNFDPLCMIEIFQIEIKFRAHLALNASDLFNHRMMRVFNLSKTMDPFHHKIDPCDNSPTLPRMKELE